MNGKKKNLSKTTSRKNSGLRIKASIKAGRMHKPF